MGLCVLYYVEYSLYNVKKVGLFYLGWNYTLRNLHVPRLKALAYQILHVAVSSEPLAREPKK